MAEQETKTYNEMETQQEYDDLQRYLSAIRSHGYPVDYRIHDGEFQLIINNKESPLFKEGKDGYDNAQSWIHRELRYTLSPHYPEKGQESAFDNLQEILETIRKNGYSASLETNYYGDSIILIIDNKSSYHYVNTARGYEAAKEWIEENMSYVLSPQAQNISPKRDKDKPTEKEIKNNKGEQRIMSTRISQEYENYLNKKFKVPVMAAQAVYLANMIECHKNSVFDLTMTAEQKQKEIDDLNEMLSNPANVYTDAEVETMTAPINQWDNIAKEAAENGDKELENFAREMNDYDNDRISFTNEAYRQDYELLNEERETLEKISEFQKIKEINSELSQDNMNEMEATIIAERPLTYMAESIKETLKTIQESRQMLKENDKQYRTVTEQALESTANRVKGKSDTMQIAVRNTISHTAKSINNVGKSLATSFTDFGKTSVGFLKQVKSTVSKGMECFCEVSSFGIYSEVKAKHMSQNYYSPDEKQQKINNLQEIHDLCWGKDNDSPAGNFVTFVGDAKVKVNDKAHNAVDTVSAFSIAMKEKTVRFGKDIADNVIQKRNSAIENISSKLDSISMNVAINKTKLEAKALLVEASFVEKTANMYEKLKNNVSEKIKRLEDYEEAVFNALQDIEKERTILIEQLVPFQRAVYQPSPELQNAIDQLNKLTSPVIYNTLCKVVDRQMKKEEKAFNKEQDKLEISHNKEFQKNEARLFELNEEFVDLIDYKNELLQKIHKESDKLNKLTDKEIGAHQTKSDMTMKSRTILQNVEKETTSPEIEMG